MDTICKRIASGVLAAALVSSVLLGVCLATHTLANANRKISRVIARCMAMGGGVICVDYEVFATEIMDELGASSVTIYEQQESGLYQSVKVFDRYAIKGLIKRKTKLADDSVWYQGAAGRKYYATVEFYGRKGEVSANKIENTAITAAT